MPQYKSIYGSIVFSIVFVSLITRLVNASPIMGDMPEEMQEKSRDKRSTFYDIQCKGIYDKSIFARVDQICEDCYNIFREPKLHSICRQNCFTSDYFKGCVDILRLTDEFGKIQEWIQRLRGLGL